MIKARLNKSLNQGSMILDVSLEIEKGALVVLYGESGAGKTTLLRLLAGLTPADHGEITVAGTTWMNVEKKINLKPQLRKIGFVFQDYMLFPNMSVQQNLVYASGSKASRIEEFSAIMGIEDILDRKPGTLSGGQKQRCALAQALLSEPEILLLDEPLSALDINMRTQLQDLILKVHREFGLTTLLVSHDLGEIFRLSDKVMKMEAGKIIAQGSPIDIFTDRKISGKFQFVGEVADLKQEDVVQIVTILVGNHPVKVITEAGQLLNIGDRVLVASKAFNPIIRKLD